MANRINAEPAVAKKTHYVSFEQGDTKLGLVLCNGRGEPDSRALQLGKMPTRALQFSQGDPDYSDMELPYTPITQKDWSGGRGQEDFEKDKTRYSDSQNIDAMYGDVILGPKATEVTLATTTDLVNAQQDSERIPNPFTCNVRKTFSIIPILPSWSESALYMRLGQTYYKGIMYDGYVSGQTRATRFQWTLANNLKKVKLWLAGTNSVTIRIFKYPTVDVSTPEDKIAILKAIETGLNDSTYGISGCTQQTFSIVESSTLTEYEFDFPYVMVQNEYYVLVVKSNKQMNQPKASRFTLEFLVGTNNTPSSLEYIGATGLIQLSADEVTWSEAQESPKWHSSIKTYSGDSLAYTLVSEQSSPGSAFFFNLRNSKFLVTSPADGSAPKLYMEGYHGFSDGSNSADKSKIMARNIGSEAVGAIVKIVGGDGSTERIRWRTITEVVTGAAGYCVVDTPWNFTHSDNTEYAIYGTGQWTEITGHGLTAAITDVCVHNDIVYFAQLGVVIRRMTCQTSAGTPDTWTFKYAAEATYATFLKIIQNEEGVKKIWRGNATSSTVASSDLAAWADNPTTILSWSSDIVCGNPSYRINGLVAYGTPRIPFVLKEDGFGSISNGIYDQIPLNEFAAVADDNNGRANLQRGVYLYLSMLNGLERYYEGRLDDMGPNRDLGLPNNRNGQISSLLAYPGRMYAAIDHPTGYSAILLYNEVGWHEIYRSALGARIHNMDVQVLDGDQCDRLWVAQEGSIAWLPVAIDPKKQNDYDYSSTGSIETAWINGNFKEIKKFFSSIVIYSENLTAAEQFVRISYKIDSDDNSWTEIDEDVDESPSQEIEFPNHAVYGKRIKIKLTLYTTSSLKSPRIRAITLKPVTRLPIKDSWTFTYRIDDNLFDMQGAQSTLTAAELYAQIKTWASSEDTPAPLLMRAPHTIFDNKYVFIEPESLRPIQWVTDDKTEPLIAIGQLTVFEG